MYCHVIIYFLVGLLAASPTAEVLGLNLKSGKVIKNYIYLFTTVRSRTIYSVDYKKIAFLYMWLKTMVKIWVPMQPML